MHFFNADSWLSLMLLALFFLLLASAAVLLIRRAERRFEQHLSDTTTLHFVSALCQVLVYLLSFVLYAHMVPQLRALGTALLAGVSVASVVVGLAAQNTLSNLIAGFSLVLYRPFRIGDRIELSAPTGLVSAQVSMISLGFTILRDEQGREILIPNSVMMGNTLIKLPPEKV